MSLTLKLLVGGIVALGSGCGETVTMPATGTIYGDLTFEDGKPALGVEVIVEGLGLTGVAECGGRFVINGLTAVDTEGMGKSYVVRGQGEHNLTPVGFFVDQFLVSDQQSYNVGRITVPPTGSIFGYVKLSGTSDHSGVFLNIEGSSLGTISRADGSYLIDRVPAYQGYRIVCVKQGYREMVLDMMPGPSGPEPITVHSEQRTDLGQAQLERVQ
jgi:hypothetical protein